MFFFYHRGYDGALISDEHTEQKFCLESTTRGMTLFTREHVSCVMCLLSSIICMTIVMYSACIKDLIGIQLLVHT